MKATDSSVLHRGQGTVVKRQKNATSGQCEIAKAGHTPRAVANLKYEHGILLALGKANTQNVPRVLRFDERADSVELILEDIGGDSLAIYAAKHPFSESEALNIALQVCDGLADIHEAGFVHKDIGFNNVIYVPTTSKAQIIDFNIAASLNEEGQSIGDAKQLAGTLTYMSPEQTGYTSFCVDRRSDLYSLGAMLYHLVSGRPPFTETRTQELLHEILTATPPPLKDITPTVPTALSKIVGKLLSKDPDLRYQSARGLMFDLQRVADGLKNGTNVAESDLGHLDAASRFVVSQKLYGRAAELRAIEQVASQSVSGPRLLLLGGPAGMGKTALVRELQKTLLEHDGFFSDGKYDQVQRHMPLSALLQAISGIVRRILEDTDVEATAQWRRRVQEALGGVGQVLADLVPLLEKLVGPQPKVFPIGPQETANRLIMVVQRFISAVCEKRSVILFFDDLQWADAASFKLLRALIVDSHLAGNLLVVGAYRSDEVDPAHPVHQLMQTCEAKATALQLKPLGVESIAELLQNATRASYARVQALAPLVARKTAGNPFFIRTFLNHLVNNRLLTFDAEKGAWVWDDESVSAASVEENVVGLVAIKLKQLPSDTQAAMKMASLLGARFAFNDLLCVMEIPRAKLATLLWPALQHDIIVARDATYRLVEHLSDLNVEYNFSHDKVQEAATQIMTAPEREQHHHLIGVKLLTRAETPLQGRELFSVADHLNKATSLLNPALRAQLASLDLLAAVECKKSTAYRMALDYLGFASEALSTLDRETHRDVIWRTGLESADCHFLLGDSASAESTLQSLLGLAVSGEDHAELKRRAVLSLTAQNKNQQAYLAASEALAHLGYAITRKPNQLKVVGKFLGLEAVLRKKPIEDLSSARQIDDKARLSVLKILGETAMPAYFWQINATAMVCLSQARFAIDNGNSIYSATAYAGMTPVYALMNNHTKANRFARLALECLRAIPGSPGGATVNFQAYGFSLFTTLPAKAMADQFRAGYDMGVENGDLLYAGYNALFDLMARFVYSLDDALLNVPIYEKYVATLQNLPQHVSCINSIQRLIAQCSSHHADAMRAELPPAECAAIQALGKPALPFYELTELIRHCLNGDLDAAASAALRAFESHLFESLADLSLMMFSVFSQLTLLEWRRQGKALTGKHGKMLKAGSAKLRSMAAASPQVMGPVVEMLAGVEKDVKGQSIAALLLLDKSSSQLFANGYNCLAAVAVENSARILSRLGLAQQAAANYERASHAYNAWGGYAKSRAMAQEAERLGETVGTLPARKRGAATDTITATRIGEISHAKNLQALDLFLTRMERPVALREVCEDAVKTAAVVSAATAAAIALAEGDLVTVGAAHGVSAEMIPIDFLRFVLQAGEPVDIDDMAATGVPEKLKDITARSIYCAPLVHLGEVVGVLYLAQDHIPNAFTGDRREIVHILSAQIASSLVSVRYQSALEETVQRRANEAQKRDERDRAQEKVQNELQLAGGFAHEMRNTLSAAMYMLRTVAVADGPDEPSLLDDLRICLDSSRADAVTAVSSVEVALGESIGSVQRGLDITKQILEYAQAGYLQAGDQGTDVGRVVDDILAEYESALNAANISMSKGIHLATLAWVREDHLKIILRNLVANAHDALRDVEALSQVRRLQLETTVTSGVVSVCVKDNGSGISAEASEKIFQPFFSTKGQHGTGLGLGLSRKLARLYGGDISFTSTPQEGTAFTIKLPVYTDKVSRQRMTRS
jgi:histidine kinase